ncbi:uncharacterized protein [Penaeus vannamei]|uniref:uncharacterized protein n=1 Tax=Penaeus vannamei TaxID=6689 RepID=UPI00387F3C9D
MPPWRTPFKKCFGILFFFDYQQLWRECAVTVAVESAANCEADAGSREACGQRQLRLQPQRPPQGACGRKPRHRGRHQFRSWPDLQVPPGREAAAALSGDRLDFQDSKDPSVALTENTGFIAS